MNPFNFFRRTRRAYARRLPPEMCRRAMLSVRVHEGARHAVQALAEKREMSTSEYVARLLNDHLAQVAGTRLLSKGFAS